MASGAAVRDQKKESLWRRRVAGQRGSGLSIRGYCQAQGLSEQAFYWWRRELLRRDREQPPASVGPAFVPVQVTEARVPVPAEGLAGTVEIVLPGDRLVRVRGPVDESQLAAVLGVLERVTRAGSRKEAAGC